MSATIRGLEARIAELEAELESKAFALDPATVQARNDQLAAENAKLREQIEAMKDSWFIARLTFEGDTVVGYVRSKKTAMENAPENCPHCNAKLIPAEEGDETTNYACGTFIGNKNKWTYRTVRCHRWENEE